MQNLAGTSDDRTLSFSHNPAGQITSRTDSNTGYAWTDFVNFDEATSYNGLNRMLSVTAQSTAPQYDGRGNMTRDHQGQTYEYDHYNRLSGVGTSIDLAYDPAGRLQETSGTGITFREMQYDGLDLIAEYDGSGTLTARYVHGPGADEPLVQYAGSAVSTRQWLLADERGSIVAVTDWSGAAIQINSYDEYGAPAPGNAGRFGYTGQVWLPETGLYHYKNRAYHPELGRFMQTDPIGVNGGMNLYAYVGGDPVNYTDPLGLEEEGIRVDGTRIYPPGVALKFAFEWRYLFPIYDFVDLEGNAWNGPGGGVAKESASATKAECQNIPGATGLLSGGTIFIPDDSNWARLEISATLAATPVFAGLPWAADPIISRGLELADGIFANAMMTLSYQTRHQYEWSNRDWLWYWGTVRSEQYGLARWQTRTETVNIRPGTRVKFSLPYGAAAFFRARVTTSQSGSFGPGCE